MTLMRFKNVKPRLHVVLGPYTPSITVRIGSFGLFLSFV